MPTDEIHVSQPALGSEIENAVVDTLRSGMIAQGSRVAYLEDQFRSAAGTKHAVAVNSGTAALIASLQALDL